jgi:hypothetical protein
MSLPHSHTFTRIKIDFELYKFILYRIIVNRIGKEEIKANRNKMS